MMSTKICNNNKNEIIINKIIFQARATLSSRNIASLREALDPGDVAIDAVALSYSGRGEVKQFAEEHELTVSVLPGSEKVHSSYKIEAFPTIYIIVETGNISSRVVGYATELGLRPRLLF